MPSKHVNLFPDIYEKMIMSYASGLTPKYRLDVKESSTSGEFLSMTIKMTIRADKSHVFKCRPIEYEYKNRDCTVDEVNRQIERIYSVKKPISNMLFVNICRECDALFMNKNNKRLRSRRCHVCIHKDMSETLLTNTPKKAKKSYVYLMLSELTGLLKIGVSQNPKRRKRALETAQGGSIQILYLLPGEQDLEQSIHKLFDQYRKDGEWFSNEKEIIEYFHDISSEAV